MAVYSNKFTVEYGPTMVRFVFLDERAQIAEGVPRAIAAVSEVVVTRENAVILRNLLVEYLKD